MQNRKPISWKKESVHLSIQASEFHYCSPRVNGLALKEYDRVEVGVIKDHGLVLPSACGIFSFDHKFEEGKSPVAGYLEAALVADLVNAFVLKYGPPDELDTEEFDPIRKG